MDNEAVIIEGPIEFYRSINGDTIQREDQGQWVLRDATGQLKDRDTYRHDLFERHNFVLKE